MTELNDHSPADRQHLHHPVRCLLAAVRFLTIIPVQFSARHDSSCFAGSLYYFPVAGLIIGCLAAGTAALLLSIAPPLIIAVLLAVTLSLLSGFLHLDGLADTADGFMSGKSSEICLEIMRDSRIGVMGAAVLCSLLMIKAAALASLNGQQLLYALVIAPVAGRCAIVFSMALLPYKRSSGGLASLFYQDSARPAATIAVILLLLLLLVLVPLKVLTIMLMFLFVTLGFAYICRTRIGGATGDTLGAICELTEAGVLIAFTLSF